MTQFYLVDENGVAVGGVFDDSAGTPIPDNWKPIQGEATLGWVWSGETSTWSPPVITIQELRDKRDKLLGDSDFSQIVDCPLPADIVQQWRDYRQQLRDLPASYDPTVPVVFPESPADTNDTGVI